jgi:protein O-GlcNAc transferase
VPVVTMEGKMHAGRVGVSLLTTVGATELIAGDEDDYVAIAAGLAAAPGRREELRGSLRGRVAGSALCDGRGFAGRMDAALRAMWREHVAG